MPSLRQLFAGAALAALTVSSPAFAQSAAFLAECTQKYQPEHPLLNPCTAATKYSAGLGRAFTASANKAGVDGSPSIFAGAFVASLERDYLKQPADKMRAVDFPKPSYGNEFRAIAVVPPKSLEKEPIAVCFEQGKKVLGTFLILTTGDVVEAPWSGAREPASPELAACGDFSRSAALSIKTKLAQQPAQPSVPPLKTSALMQ